MLHYQILLVLGLVFAIIGLHILSAKIRISYPILVVMGGVAISLIPGIPEIALNPDWVFLIFLPPLLYEAAWYTSWRDFWQLKAPISTLAFGLVFFTSIVVAYYAKGNIPGFTLAVGFLLGGIISPPDAVTAETVLKGIKAPKDAVTIIKGESLINDASSLIVFKFALAAILTNKFVLHDAATHLLWVTGGGMAIGVATAQAVYFIRKRLNTTPSIETVFTLVSPYLFYLLAESVESSGVLAVVSGGLFLSYRSHEFLTAKSQVQSGSVWSTLTFLLNGFLFLLIGLQLPMVIRGLSSGALIRGAIYAYILSVIAIGVRITWVMFTNAVMNIREPRKRRFDWKNDVLIAWAGMRGIVSLAAALSIPLALPDGSPFPNRNMVLYITFCFILLTLIGQGLSLPLLIRHLSFGKELERGTPQQQRESMAMRLALSACEQLDLRYRKECEEIPMFAQLRTSYEWIVSSAVMAGGSSRESHRVRALEKRYKEALLELIKTQRRELVIARREGTYDHEIILETEDQLNLEETRLTRSEVEPASQIISPATQIINPGSQIMRPRAEILNPASRPIEAH